MTIWVRCLAAYTSYVMGFFSGINVVYEDDTGLNQFEGLYQEAISNCKAAPDASFVAAIINLYAELKTNFKGYFWCFFD